MQFEENPSNLVLCPVCKKNKVPKRTTRGQVNYCSKVCKSQLRFSTRYRGSLAGPMDRPTLEEKTKLPS